MPPVIKNARSGFQLNNERRESNMSYLHISSCHQQRTASKKKAKIRHPIGKGQCFKSFNVLYEGRGSYYLGKTIVLIRVASTFTFPLFQSFRFYICSLTKPILNFLLSPLFSLQFSTSVLIE